MRPNNETVTVGVWRRQVLVSDRTTRLSSQQQDQNQFVFWSFTFFFFRVSAAAFFTFTPEGNCGA